MSSRSTVAVIGVDEMRGTRQVECQIKIYSGVTAINFVMISVIAVLTLMHCKFFLNIYIFNICYYSFEFTLFCEKSTLIQ